MSFLFRSEPNYALLRSAEEASRSKKESILRCSLFLTQNLPLKPGSVSWYLTATNPTAIYLRSGISSDCQLHYRIEPNPPCRPVRFTSRHGHPCTACALTTRFRPCPHPFGPLAVLFLLRLSRGSRPVGFPDYSHCCLPGLSSLLTE